MKFDKDGNGKLDKKEFDEATKEKDGINFKDPKVILAIIGVAITVIGVIAALCVWLSRRSKKKKADFSAFSYSNNIQYMDNKHHDKYLYTNHNSIYNMHHLMNHTH